MHEMASQRANISKISRGSMPPDPPRNSRLRRSQISLAEKLLQLKRTPPPRLETRLLAWITFADFQSDGITPSRTDAWKIEHDRGDRAHRRFRVETMLLFHRDRQTSEVLLLARPVVDRRNYSRDFHFPLRIKAKILEYAPILTFSSYA